MTVKRLTIRDAKQTEGVQPQDKKSNYLRLIAKQQLRLGEDSPLSNIKKMSSKTRAQQPATRSSFDPIEYE